MFKNLFKPVAFEQRLQNFLSREISDLFRRLEFQEGMDGTSLSGFLVAYKLAMYRHKVASPEFTQSFLIESLPINEVSKAYLHKVQNAFCDRPQFAATIANIDNPLECGVAIAQFLDQNSNLPNLKFRRPDDLALTVAIILKLGLEDFSNCSNKQHDK